MSGLFCDVPSAKTDLIRAPLIYIANPIVKLQR